MNRMKKTWINVGSILAVVGILATAVSIAASYSSGDGSNSNLFLANLWKYLLILLFVAVWIILYIYRIKQQNSAELRELFERGTVNDLLSKALESNFSCVLLLNLSDDQILFSTSNGSQSNFENNDLFSEKKHYSEILMQYVQSFVSEEHRLLFLSGLSLESIRSKVLNSDKYDLKYHVINKNYSYESAKVSRVDYLSGKEYCVITFESIENEKLLESQIEKCEEIISSLSGDYLCVSTLYLSENLAVDYQLKSETQELIPGWQETENYTARMMLLVNQTVIPQEKNRVEEESKIENIKETLSCGRETNIVFHALEEGKSSTYLLRFMPVSSDKNVALFVLQPMDDRFEQMQKANAKNAVISALTEDFVCVAYVDLIQNRIENCRIDDAFINLIPGWRSISDYAVRIRLLADSLVVDADRERLLVSMSPGNILRGLSVEKTNVYYVTFRIALNGEARIYQAKFVQDPENRNAVVLGIHDIDADRRKEMEKQTQEGAEILRSDFLKRLGSDLVKPLDELQSVVNEIKSEPNETGKKKTQVTRLEDSTKKLIFIANDIQNLAKARTENSQAALAPMDMFAFANVCSSAITEVPQKKKYSFITDFEDISHPYVIGDELHLRQIIQNLLENAVRFTPENGKVLFRIAELCSDEETITFKIDISDSGNGMKQDVLEHIWDIFTIRDAYSNEGNSDVSRNLAVSKAVADAIGATITVESTVGEGTTFCVFIKLAQDKNLENQNKKNEVLNGMHILLAEDNELNRVLLKESLENVGATVTPVKNGVEAVAAFRNSSEEHIDLALLDLMMPEMNGIEASIQIRNISGLDQDGLPLFAMVSNASEEEITAAKEAGINAFLNKPVRVPALMNAMIQFINNRSQQLEIELANANVIATTDALTGVRNRNAFEQMEKQIDSSLKSGQISEFAIVFCDVNDLKKTNDTEGHDVGDQLIQKACSIICDIFKHSPVFRIGGDEFAVVLRGADFDARETLMATLVRNGFYGEVSIACGLADYSPKDSGFASVFKRADAKMYENKKRIKSGNVPMLL